MYMEALIDGHNKVNALVDSYKANSFMYDNWWKKEFLRGLYE